MKNFFAGVGLLILGLGGWYIFCKGYDMLVRWFNNLK